MSKLRIFKQNILVFFFLQEFLFGETISFQQAIELSLVYSPALKQAEALRDAQRERKRSAWSSVGPKVRAEYNDVRFNHKQEMNIDDSLITLRDDHTKIGSLTITQPILGFYGLAERALFEGEREIAQEKTLELVKQEVSYRAAEAYVRSQAADAMLQVAEASSKAMEQQAHDAQSQFDVGRINQGEVLKLKVAVSEAQAKLAQAHANRTVAYAALRESIGLDINSEIILDSADLSTVQKKINAPELAEAIHIVMQNNPEMAIAQANKEIATYGKKLAATEFVPSLNLFARVERNFSEDIFPQQKDTRSYGVSLVWDLWSNGSSIFNLREASSQIIAAESNVKLTEQKLRLELMQILSNLTALQISLNLAEASISQATEAYRIEKAKFDLGRSTASELVLAEASLTNAKGRLVSAHADLRISLFALQRLLGWQIKQLN